MYRRSIVIILFLVSFSSCSKLDRIRQLRTFADMQVIVGKLEDLRKQNPSFINEQMRINNLLSETAQGKDAWHHDYVFLSRVTERGPSYILISKGSDNRLDVRNPEDYFSLTERYIHDEPWKDIVFRDGQPVTLAGK